MSKKMFKPWSCLVVYIKIMTCQHPLFLGDHCSTTVRFVWWRRAATKTAGENSGLYGGQSVPACLEEIKELAHHNTPHCFYLLETCSKSNFIKFHLTTCQWSLFWQHVCVIICAVQAYKPSWPRHKRAWSKQTLIHDCIVSYMLFICCCFFTGNEYVHFKSNNDHVFSVTEHRCNSSLLDYTLWIIIQLADLNLTLTLFNLGRFS